MAIRTGIGVGAAQIADTSNIMNAYARQVAQQQKAQALQAEREAKAQAKFDEDLADVIASVKTEGARDVDIPDITNAYNEIKEYYSKSGSLKDKDKPLFRAELMNRVRNLNEFAARSNKLSKDVLGISSDIAKNEWDYDPNAVLEIKTIAQTPLKQLGERAIIDPLKYKRQPNFGLIENILDKTYDLGKQNADFVGEVMDNGKRRNVSRVPKEFIINALVQSTQSDPEALQSLRTLYVRNTGDAQPTPDKLTGFLKDLYETRHKYDYLGEVKDLRRAGRGGGTTNEEDKLSYRQQIIGGALQKDDESIEKIRAQLPSGTKIVKKTSTAVPGKSKGGYPLLEITIPGTGTRQEFKETINLASGQPGIRLNQILNEYSGENIQYSKFGISGARPRGEQFEPERGKVKTPSKPTQNTKSKKTIKGF